MDSEPEAEVTVVLLGWLGAKPKHLRRYVDMYNAKGIRTITFIVSVKDIILSSIPFGNGKKLEDTMQKLYDELAAWLDLSHNANGASPQRFLLFHTFSNTGWLGYAGILDHLKDREDFLEKIIGCVVDSGADPYIDPKVWAAGFSAALLKKKSSATQSILRRLLLVVFEKLFSYVLNLPALNGSLRKLIATLSMSQPPCPQLYLYSSGDEVIPFRRVESFMEEQRKTGKHVFSYNFGASSPHVDHYRTFPHVYTSQLDIFLKQCSIINRKKMQK